MTTMMAAPSDVFGNWAEVYDEQPNPLLSLEQRFLNRMLPDAAGLDVLTTPDAAQADGCSISPSNIPPA